MPVPIPKLTKLPPSPGNLSKHSQYYIKGGDLHVLVETIHFCVHSYFFVRESQYWKELLTPPKDGELCPGAHESTAIVLKDITPDDFANILWVFYNERFHIFRANCEKWQSIVRLSIRWGMENVRKTAIDHMGRIQMEPVARIKLYNEIGVPRHFLAPYYEQLAIRSELFTPEEFRMLDPGTIHLIVTAREILRAPPVEDEKKGLLSPTRNGITRADIEKTVNSVFGITPEERRLEV